MLNKEQQLAYDRFIKARNKVRVGGYGRGGLHPVVPQSAVTCTVDIAGFNHPFYERNDDWIEYLEASSAWWAIEPEFRKKERMSMIRGDYGDSDSWKDKKTIRKEIE
jgi:hypothetical protein